MDSQRHQNAYVSDFRWPLNPFYPGRLCGIVHPLHCGYAAGVVALKQQPLLRYSKISSKLGERQLGRFKP